MIGQLGWPIRSRVDLLECRKRPLYTCLWSGYGHIKTFWQLILRLIVLIDVVFKWILLQLGCCTHGRSKMFSIPLCLVIACMWKHERTLRLDIFYDYDTGYARSISHHPKSKNVRRPSFFQSNSRNSSITSHGPGDPGYHQQSCALPEYLIVH